MAKTNFMIILRKDIWCKTHRGSRVQGNRVLWNSQVWVTFPWVCIVAHSDQTILHYKRWWPSNIVGSWGPEMSLATRFLPLTIFILRAHFPTICLIPGPLKEWEGFDSAISWFFQSCFTGDLVVTAVSDSWRSFTPAQKSYVYLTLSQRGTHNSVSSPPFKPSCLTSELCWSSCQPKKLPRMQLPLSQEDVNPCSFLFWTNFTSSNFHCHKM